MPFAFVNTAIEFSLWQLSRPPEPLDDFTCCLTLKYCPDADAGDVLRVSAEYIPTSIFTFLKLSTSNNNHSKIPAHHHGGQENGVQCR
jgi:hypothetical protein